ncbi:hypothetical protein [Chitinophaga sp. S165]|uniref:hypothetical protein n=1 Tax=Chitinophaga sp. S165 TaxID=2135462 RepID=UPI000D70D889|nr:hypothetical protein [Chitinophaga sp. S165]PWV47105.1 hypothetical protein C7475_109193 [Chitinophaga sp. S165]
MKRAKIILTAIAVLGVTAGVFAFKAARQTDVIYTGPAVGEPCTVTVQFKKIDASGINTFATLDFGADCEQVKTINSNL